MLPKANDSWTPVEAAHLLNRAGFGGSPAEIAELHALGRVKAVDFLLGPEERIDAFPPPEWAERERAVAEMQQRVAEQKELQKELMGMSAEQADQRKREANKEYQQQNRVRSLAAQGWWFRRILKTKAPLREKMTLFWHDHFATSLQKVKQPVLMIWQNELFRQEAFGSFKNLTRKILMDPAMVIFLDVQSSKKGKPNENFAREVLELFTLGEGHYSEQDIREAARAFTGYQLKRGSGQVFHNRRQWDEGNKTVFGNAAAFDGDQVIELIFQQKETARFIAKKIWEYFVYETPPEKAVDALAETLRQADYRLEPLLREIFLSQEFYAVAALRTQIKCPVQYLVELLKQLEINEPPVGFPIIGQQQLGQTLFLPPNVAGWDWGKAWINTNTLLVRYNLAGYLTKGAAGMDKSMVSERDKIPGMGKAPKNLPDDWSGPDYEKIAPRSLRENPTSLVDSLIFRFFQAPLPDKARDSFIQYAMAKKGAIFTNKEVAELCHLMLSTPYYQLT